MEERGEHINKPSLGKETRQFLKDSRLAAKKSLGQHFLVDRGVLGKILAAGEVTESDTVIDVGPGLGVLTVELARLAKHVACVEIDSTLALNLREKLAGCDNVNIVNKDILETSPSDLLPCDETRYKVVANLPYYITSPVLRHFLEAVIPPDLMIVMVQKEVAKSITAPPGKMSLLSVGIQLYGNAKIVANVSAKSFHPVPKVESAIVRIARYPEVVVPPQHRASFFEIVRAGFGSPRKQLVNTLSHGLDIEKERTREKLLEAEIEPSRRAESLSIADWCRLWKVFQQAEGDKC